MKKNIKKIALIITILASMMLICACSSVDTSSRPDPIHVASVLTINPATAQSTKAPTKAPTIAPTLSNEPTYIYNKNTHKFHYPYCSSVDDMKEKNKVKWYDSREALMKKYPSAVPCKRCKP